MKRGVRQLAVVVAIACAATSSGAAVLILDEAFNGIPNYSTDLTFTQWDNSWGTLNSIRVDLFMTSIGGELRVDNDSASPASSSVSFGSRGSLGSSDVVLFTSTFQPILSGGSAVIAATSDSLSLAANDGDGEVGGTSSFSSQGADFGQVTGGTVNNSGFGMVGSFFWGAGNLGFIGSSTYDITVTADQYVSLGSLGGAQQQIDPLSVTGMVRVTYDYSGSGPPPESGGSVPEPSSLVLVSVCGVFLARMRRINKAMNHHASSSVR